MSGAHVADILRWRLYTLLIWLPSTRITLPFT